MSPVLRPGRLYVDDDQVMCAAHADPDAWELSRADMIELVEDMLITPRCETCGALPDWMVVR